MLELIFQGFLQWVYDLTVELWEFFADSLIGIMSMDFAYLREHMPVIDTIQQSMLAIGWALLIGNLIFQAAKSMMSGLGFEGEDPKLLFTRTFVFSFLLLVSPQICELCLNMTSTVIQLIQMPASVEVTFFDENAFEGLACAWLIVIICGAVIIFKSLKLILEMAERYFILAVLTITAPLAFGVGGSKNTSEIFTGWCRMYGSMCLLMVTNVMFVKMLFSVLSVHPTGIDVFPWMVLLLTVVKVAKKADEIVTRIGLNPAITGGAKTSLPGMLTYTVLRTAAAQVTKTVGASLNGDSKNTGEGTSSRTTGPRAGGAARGKTGGYYAGARYARQQNSSRSTNQQAGNRQSSSFQGGSRQTSAQANTRQTAHTNTQKAARTGTQQTTAYTDARKAPHTAAQDHTAQTQATTHSANTAAQTSSQTFGGSRKGSSSQGSRRSHGYSGNTLGSPGGRPGTGKGGINRSNTKSGSGSAGVSATYSKANPVVTQYTSADTTVQVNSATPGTAGTGSSAPTSRANRTAQQSVRGQAGPKSGRPAQTQSQPKTRSTRRPADSAPEKQSARPPSKQPRYGRNAVDPHVGTPYKEPHSAPTRQEPHRAAPSAKESMRTESARFNPGTAGTAPDRPGAGQTRRTAQTPAPRAETGPLAGKHPGTAGNAGRETSSPAKQAGMEGSGGKFRRVPPAAPAPAMKGANGQTADKSTKRGGKDDGGQQ